MPARTPNSPGRRGYWRCRRGLKATRTASRRIDAAIDDPHPSCAGTIGFTPSPYYQGPYWGYSC
jgi:hypothetical protein